MIFKINKYCFNSISKFYNIAIWRYSVFPVCSYHLMLLYFAAFLKHEWLNEIPFPNSSLSIIIHFCKLVHNSLCEDEAILLGTGIENEGYSGINWHQFKSPAPVISDSIPPISCLWLRIYSVASSEVMTEGRENPPCSCLSLRYGYLLHVWGNSPACHER